MRSNKMGRALALILTLLMVVSTFVVLPAAAETVDGKDVLWSHDFAADGNQDKYSVHPNGGQKDVLAYGDGYFAKNDIFHLSGIWNSYAYIQNGKFYIGYNSRLYPENTTGSNPNQDFYSLLQGTYSGYDTAGSSYFFETDFYSALDGATAGSGVRTAKVDSSASWSYTDENGEVVTGSGAIYSDYGNGVGGHFFNYKSKYNTNTCLFRIAANGLAYTQDNANASMSTLLSYGGVYYLDENGQPVYFPSGAKLTDASLDYCIVDPAKAYQLEKNVQYRLGVQFDVDNVVVDETTGIKKVTTSATVYIKKANEPYWSHCIGTSKHTETLSGDYIELNNRAYSTLIGGKSEIYHYDCNGVDHVNALMTASAADPSRYTCKCIDCGKTWKVREIDGVFYEGKEFGTVCEGTYMVWVPMQGIGTPIAETVYSEAGTGHSYNQYGQCTACGKYEYVTEIPEGFSMSRAGNSTTNVNNYIASSGTLKVTHSGVDYMNGNINNPEIGKSYKPLTVSFDFMLSACDWNTSLAKPGNFAELLALQPGTGTGQQVLQIGMDGNNQPFLCFATDFRADQTKTYETVKVALVDGAEDTTDPNYEKVEQYKDYYGRNCGGIAWTYDDSGSIRTYTFYNHNVGSYYLTLGEWINISFTILPNKTNNKATLMLYVNGELVGMRPNALGWNEAFHAVRWNPGSVRYTKPTYYIDNLGVRFHDTVEEAYTNKMAGTEVFTYRFDRFQAVRHDANFTAEDLGATRNNTYPLMGRFEDAFDSKIVMNNGSYAHYNNPDAISSDRITLLLSSKINGEFTHLSNNEYEIDVTLAMDEAKAGEVGNPCLIRLSKYRDNYVALKLVYLKTSGYWAMIGGAQQQLINAAGIQLSPYTTVTDGVPEAFSNLRAVIDEKNNTYSIYVDGNVAYYEKDGERIPVEDITLPAPEGTGVTEAKKEGSGFTGDVTKYYDFTEAYAQQLVTNGVLTDLNTAGEYVCLMQWIKDFFLENVAVRIIPDSVVEYVGVQERVNDSTFDLRFIAALDDIYADGVGFMVEAYLNDQYVGRETVYQDRIFKAVDANGSTFDAYETDKGSYLTAVKIVGIEKTTLSDTYTFKITPMITYENGDPQESYQTHTVVYNGLGQCLNNGFPFEDVNLEDYKELASPAVMLEMTPKTEGDYSTFYVYVRCADSSGRYYVRYNFSYEYDTATTNETNSATNINAFRIKGANLVKISGISDTAVTYTQVAYVLGQGEISLAIKEYVYGIEKYKTEKNEEGETVFVLDENGEKIPIYGNSVQDFIGGFHGDEKIESFALTADGVSYTPGAEGKKVVCCSELVIDQTTVLERWEEGLGDDGAKEPVVKQEQTFTINRNGIGADRTLTWLVSDFAIDAAYPMMFTLQRVTDSTETAPVCEIVDIYDANGNKIDGMVTNLSYPSQKNFMYHAEGREARYSSATSGISAKAGVKNLSGVNVKDTYIACRPGSDNKWYVNMNSAENGANPVAGEVWSLTCYYHIDYVNPANN